MSQDDIPLDLFGEPLEDVWKKEWWGMPEFLQEDLTPHQSILVHFENEEAVEEFAKLTEQTITKLTKSVWFPKAEFETKYNKRYVDEVKA